jgi:hypothetical protein
MMNDLASATSSPPAEFTAASWLMRNSLEFPYPLYFGRETGLYFGGHGAVCNPSESGESGSANCEILLPVKKFYLEVLLFWPEFWCGESATANCSLVLTFHQFLFAFFSICSFAWLSLSSFTELFFLIPVGSQIYPYLSETAALFGSPFLVLCQHLDHHPH